MLVVWTLFSVLLCAACSILETVLFSARTVRLLNHRDRPGVTAFLHIKETRIGDAISAILIINTVAGTVGPGFVGAEAARIWGSPAVAMASAALTFLILILSEIGPKTYAATHAERLAGITGQVLRVTLWCLAPALFVTRWLTAWLSGDEEGTITRNSLAQIIAYAPSQGALSSAESDVLAHMLFSHKIHVAEAATPIAHVVSVPAHESLGVLLDSEEHASFARIPLFHGKHDNLIGYVNQREVLREGLRDPACKTRPLSDFSHALPRLDHRLTVGRAIAALLDAREPIGAVVRDGQVIGIATLEDLFEGLLGVDITDEAEEIAENRSQADVARRERLKRLRERRREWAGTEETASREPGPG